MKEKISRLVSYIEAILLPIILAILFVIQNQAFNSWLGLYSKTYSARLSLVTLALGFILYGPALLFKKRYKYIYLFLISFLVFIIFSVQFLYYRYSQSFLQFSAIKYITQTNSVAGTVKTLLTPEILLFFSSVLVVLLARILSLRKNYVEFISPKWEKVVIVTAMIIISFFGYKHLLDTERKEWGSTSRLYTDVYDLKALVGKMGIMNFFLEDTFKYALRARLVTSADVDFVKTWAKNKKTPEYSDKYFGIAKNRNLIIIQVESLENSVINKAINGQEITPNLNRLTKEGLYFDNFYSQIGPGNTADAEFSTLNSLYALPDDVVFIDYAKNKYNALPEVLKNNSYGTYCFHGDVPTFWNRSNIYPGLGYQKAFDLDEFTVTRSVGKGPSDLGDEDLFSQSLQKFSNLKQPFLATVITMSSHTPFILPDDLQTLNIPSEMGLDWIQSGYLQSVHYTDGAIGNFINGLKANGMYNNSLILIWGDHDSFTNISSILAPEKNSIPELVASQVPLIVLAPGTNLNGTNNEPSSQIDVFPTITNLLGVKTPKSILGQDLLNTKTPVETHFKLISGGIDAILTPDLLYRASEDGEFKNGSCQTWPSQKLLPIADCQAVYQQQANAKKVSNTVIRGNLLNLIAF